MSRFTLVIVCAFLLALPGSRSALSHDESDTEGKAGIGSSGAAWSVRGDYFDFHSAPHGNEQVGFAEVHAVVVSAPGFKLSPGPEGPTAIYSLKVVASMFTPLVRLIRAEAMANNNGPGYHGSGMTDQGWKGFPIDARGQIYLEFGRSHTGRSSVVGHKNGPSTSKAVMAPPTDSVTVISAGGIPAVVLDEVTGAVIEIVLDENGHVVWDVPPVAYARLTSSLIMAGGTCTYTYKIENLGDDPLSFVMPEITAPAFPSGWSGTVAPATFELTTFNDPGLPYSQHATFSVTETEDSERSSTQITTGAVFVPQDRLVFGGINTISASYYDTLLQANVVEFTVTEDASLALLLRADPEGDQIVDELEDVSVGLLHEVLDYSFLPGPNDYRVRTGSGVNGWEQTEAVTILN